MPNPPTFRQRRTGYYCDLRSRGRILFLPSPKGLLGKAPFCCSAARLPLDRHTSLTKRLAAKQAEKSRYVKLYAQGQMDDEELGVYLTDLQKPGGEPQAPYLLRRVWPSG